MTPSLTPAADLARPLNETERACVIAIRQTGRWLPEDANARARVDALVATGRFIDTADGLILLARFAVRRNDRDTCWQLVDTVRGAIELSGGRREGLCAIAQTYNAREAERVTRALLAR